MQNLLKKKLEAVERLKIFTEEIMMLSPKADHKKIKSMLEKRKKQIEAISTIDNKIKLLDEKSICEDMDEINSIKDKIKNSVFEIINMDKQLRKNISSELKNISAKINKPETSSGLLNIKV
jgi:translation initiation factor 2 gamma subunit (eIF-2gamma)